MKAQLVENDGYFCESPDKGAPVLPLSKSDEAIVRGLVAGERWAANALYDRYSRPVARMLRRTLGQERHADFEDLLHEVFVEALRSARSLRDSVALLAWLQTIAARVAIRTIRRRKARNWLRFHEPENLPEVASPTVPPEIRHAYTRFYVVLNKLPASEQLVFTMRYIEGMEIPRVAETCEISLSTAKRRMNKAKDRFYRLAAAEPELVPWLAEQGGNHE